MKEQEKRIKDQRTIDANRKNLMGLEGKLGCILKYLGEPLVRQDEGEWFHNVRTMDEEEDVEWGGTPEEIITQISTEDWGAMLPDECYRSERKSYDVEEVGLLFDGLSSGINLELRYRNDDGRLTARWEGHLVYDEIAGDLQCFVPMQEWEDKVNLLFPLAKKREVAKAHTMMDTRKEKVQKDKLSLLDRIRKKWGV